MVTRTAPVSTTNQHLEQEIKLEIEITVPGDLEEASEFFGGEEKLLDSIQSDVQRRKVNAARQILRESEQELDWEAVAVRVAESYQPGRRGGFQAVEVSTDEIAEAAGDVDSLLALLAAKGVSISQ